MKRILVIDDSAVVRETLALVLGSEFFVLKRPPETGVDALVRADEKIDLLIYGVVSGMAVAGMMGSVMAWLSWYRWCST